MSRCDTKVQIKGHKMIRRLMGSEKVNNKSHDGQEKKNMLRLRWLDEVAQDLKRVETIKSSRQPGTEGCEEK